jgi:hypothetical protein
MHVQNVHTMDELKMTGNCLKGSRGLLSFDASFETTEWGKFVKELFTHVGDFSLFRIFYVDHSLLSCRFLAYLPLHERLSHSSIIS